jgi:uncharacterized protein with ParB-like and HNH nuclease domain
MKENKEEPIIEEIPSEIEDSQTSEVAYDIVTYPADFTLEGLISKYRSGDIIIPGFQRKFVWNINQASRLVESFLLGLPVPSIFFYLEPKTQKHLVIDGQQRVLSIYYFMEGYFGEAKKGKRILFKLKGLNENSPYLEKTYQDIKDTNEASYRRLNDSVLRAFIVKQLRPEGHASIYEIFERLNTGGSQLVGQEIRNCIYHGLFNDLLGKLNTNEKWRLVFGKKESDKRQRDVELILRFFALYYEGRNYFKPMKAFLSKFMDSNKGGQRFSINQCKNLFEKTINNIYTQLGTKPFHIKAGLNAAMFDSVSVAFAKHSDSIPAGINKRYKSLQKDKFMNKLISSATTDLDVVTKRLLRAEKKLFK